MEIIGKITEKEYYDDHTIFIGDMEQPLSEYWTENLAQKNVSVRYFISDQPIKDIAKALMAHLYGDADVEYYARYSDLTGYLYTDEKLIVGGHDLLKEISCHVGKYLHLEVYAHQNPTV